MKVTLKQPALNVLRSLLNQEGYIKDFGDFYLAGKSLSLWPREKYLHAGATDEDLRHLENTTHELEVSEDARKLVKQALIHYIASKKAPTQLHYEVCTALQIKD